MDLRVTWYGIGLDSNGAWQHNVASFLESGNKLSDFVKVRNILFGLTSVTVLWPICTIEFRRNCTFLILCKSSEFYVRIYMGMFNSVLLIRIQIRELNQTDTVHGSMTDLCFCTNKPSDFKTRSRCADVFLNMTLWGLVDVHRRFKGTYCLDYQYK